MDIKKVLTLFYKVLGPKPIGMFVIQTLPKQEKVEIISYLLICHNVYYATIRSTVVAT